LWISACLSVKIIRNATACSREIPSNEHDEDGGVGSCRDEDFVAPTTSEAGEVCGEDDYEAAKGAEAGGGVADEVEGDDGSDEEEGGCERGEGGYEVGDSLTGFEVGRCGAAEGLGRGRRSVSDAGSVSGVHFSIFARLN
jgi:hypothetical protein